MERGFNVFAVDAPGDTATRIYNPELLIKGAGDRALLSQIDYILQHPEVDPSKINVPFLTMAGEKELQQKSKGLRRIVNSITSRWHVKSSSTGLKGY